MPARSTAWMNEKVAAPVDTLPLSLAVSAAVWLSLAAPNWIASPPLVPCMAMMDTSYKQTYDQQSMLSCSSARSDAVDMDKGKA